MDQQTCGLCMTLLPISAFATNPRSTVLSTVCRVCTSGRTALGRHGLTAADKTQIAEAQEGCAICGRLEPGKKGWVVDHDRACCPNEKSCWECRRAILCQWCNNALGYAMDSPVVLRRMADYLEMQTRLGSDPLGRQSTDRSTDSLNRSAAATPTLRTDGTYGEVTTAASKSSTSVPRARITDVSQVAAEGRRFAPAWITRGTA